MVILNEYSKKYSKNQSPTEENEMSDSDIAIKVDGVNKAFKLPHEKQSSVKGMFVGLFQGKRTYTRQQVLKDISFEIKKGEFFGIVGRNGSGKSTLLKLLAGIYTPDKGNIQVNGSLTPFIELGVGFNPELTGRENVYLNGALLGFNRKQMDALYNEIVEFAELEKFMDQKLKNYSSGMQVRLAFSIAIRAKSDILLIDEVLAVGDAAFQRKCYEYFVQLKKEIKTVVLVTHDMGAVERFCDRALVIRGGKNIGVFNRREAAVLYEKINFAKSKKTEEIESKPKDRWGTKKAYIEDIYIESLFSQKKITKLSQGSDLKFVIKTGSKKKNLRVVVGLAIYDEFGVNIAGPNSRKHHAIACNTIIYSINNLPLNPGKYYVTAVLFDEDTIEEFDHIEKATSFNIISNSGQQYGKINLFGDWEIQP